MSKFEKQLKKMRDNPLNWHIEDIKAIANRLGIEYRQPGTSHMTFRFPTGKKLTIPAHRPIKGIYVKQFINLIDDGEFSNE